MTRRHEMTLTAPCTSSGVNSGHRQANRACRPTVGITQCAEWLVVFVRPLIIYITWQIRLISEPKFCTGTGNDAMLQLVIFQFLGNAFIRLTFIFNLKVNNLHSSVHTSNLLHGVIKMDVSKWQGRHATSTHTVWRVWPNVTWGPRSRRHWQ